MIGMFLKNYKKFKAKKIRIGGEGKMKKWHTVDFSK